MLHFLSLFLQCNGLTGGKYAESSLRHTSFSQRGRNVCAEEATAAVCLHSGAGLGVTVTLEGTGSLQGISKLASGCQS